MRYTALNADRYINDVSYKSGKDTDGIFPRGVLPFYAHRVYALPGGAR